MSPQPSALRDTRTCFSWPRLIAGLGVMMAVLTSVEPLWAQSSLSKEFQLRTNFEPQSRTLFEPTFRTNFEADLPNNFAFQSNRSVTQVRLAERLNQLQPRLPEERKYVAEIIELVDKGQLPEPVVDQAFFYAIQRYGGPMPFPYFERIMEIHGQRLKVDMPVFDRTIYSKERFRPQLFSQ